VETCWTVIHGAAAGEPKQRSAFVRLYEPAIRAYLLRRWQRSPLRQDVDDHIQEVFLTCFRDDGALAQADRERGSGFRAYLYGVVRNVARHAETRRARSRETNGHSALEQIDADEDSLAAEFDRAWAQSVVRDAIGRMDNRRDVDLLQARFVDDMPIRDIARAWREDPAKLHHDYARARRSFQDALVAVVRFHQPDRSPEQALEEAKRLLSLLA